MDCCIALPECEWGALQPLSPYSGRKQVSRHHRTQLKLTLVSTAVIKELGRNFITSRGRMLFPVDCSVNGRHRGQPRSVAQQPSDQRSKRSSGNIVKWGGYLLPRTYDNQLVLSFASLGESKYCGKQITWRCRPAAVDDRTVVRNQATHTINYW